MRTKVILYVILVFLGIGLFGTILRYCNNASNTAYKEFNAAALLKKYEYFKDVSAQLDKKLADIKIYEGKVKSLENDYKDISRQKWARDDREQLSIWKSELDGIKASYNGLAAEYNSAMSKFNYSFCNVGELPKGASEPLPKEYKPYIEK